MDHLILFRALAIVLPAFSFVAFAHEGNHSGKMEKQGTKVSEGSMAEIYKEIDSSYSQKVRPTFERSCFACHSSTVSAPWYAKLPIAKQLITSDMTEAKEHLELSKGFPFGGHGTPSEDLEAIRKSVGEQTMPTRFYRLMHPSSALSEEEKKQVIEWANEGLKQISTVHQEKPAQESKHHK